MTVYENPIYALNDLRSLVAIDRLLNRNQFTSKGPISDSRFQAARDDADGTHHRLELLYGVIVDIIPAIHCYKVKLDDISSPITCNTLQTGGCGVFTLKDSSCYAVGINVAAMVNKRTGRGTILGAVNFPRDVTYGPINYFLDGASKCKDRLATAALEETDPKNTTHGIYDYSDGMLQDVVGLGEFCKQTFTGNRIFLDPFVCSASANDYTGLWLFNQDGLTRLSGLNLQIRSTGRESEFLNDEGEYIEYSGSVLYPWEMLGYLQTPQSDIIKEAVESEKFYNSGYKSVYTPEEYLAQPFHRITEFGGWIGQGKQTQIVVPPNTGQWHTLDNQLSAPCVSRLTQSVDGLLSFESAKGVLITKRGMFPGVVRRNRPDVPYDVTGDTKDTYNREKQQLPTDFTTSEGEQSGLCRAAGLSDYTGYNLNWKNIFPFAYHSKDYTIPEESSLEHGSFNVPDFSELEEEQYLSDSESYSLNIDDGRKDQKFFQAEAGIALLPEGGIVIYDGYGGEIRMVNGSISISAPGDIEIRPGRTTHIWSGKDTIIRSKKDIDVSSSDSFVRIKAENSLELLGGNSGTGGVLVESKSKSSSFDFSSPGNDVVISGIVLKSSNSPVAVLGDDVYIKSGSDNSSGNIYLNANEGKSSIYTVANSNSFYVKNAQTVNFFDSAINEVNSVTKFTRSTSDLQGETRIHGGAVISKSLSVGGQLQIMGGLICADSILAKGSIVSEAAPPAQAGNKESTLVKSLSDVIDKTEEASIATAQQTQNVATVISNTGFSCVEGSSESTTVEEASFSFRVDAEYGAENFKVYESRWQQMSRIKGSTSCWEENSVSSTNYETYPYPGSAGYADNCYVTQELTIADYSKNRYKNRMNSDEEALKTNPSEPYSDPKFESQNNISLNKYVII